MLMPRSTTANRNDGSLGEYRVPMIENPQPKRGGLLHEDRVTTTFSRISASPTTAEKNPGQAAATEPKETTPMKRTKKFEQPVFRRCVVRASPRGKRCPHAVFIQKHQLCVGHYKRLVRDGAPGGLLRRRRDLAVPA